MSLVYLPRVIAEDVERQRRSPLIDEIKGLRAISPQNFKNLFRVGDWITNRVGGKELRITAIGEHRFLYMDAIRGANVEHVAMIRGTHWIGVRRG